MPRERLSMRKIKEVLRLRWEGGLSHRAIAAELSAGADHGAGLPGAGGGGGAGLALAGGHGRGGAGGRGCFLLRRPRRNAGPFRTGERYTRNCDDART